MLAYPFLSFEQERMLFLNKLNPGNPAQHERGAVQICGPLDLAVLEQSAHEIICRHELLRTSFTLIHGQPSQVIASSLRLSIPIHDLQAHSSDDRNRIAQELATTIVQQSFELDRCPLWRLGLIRLGVDEHLFVISMHHIISDGDASIHLFFRELAIFYTSLSGGPAASLPELTIQYQDFARWQRQMKHTEEKTRHLAYWKQQLNGVEPVLQLPIDHPRPPLQTYAGASQPLILPQNLSEKLKQLSQQTAVSLQAL